MTRNRKATRKATAPRKRVNNKPSERGLGPDGGAWNLKQAAAWCGIGENYLRTMAKNREIPVAYFIGRRIIVPREGFMDWFNRRAGNLTGGASNAA